MKIVISCKIVFVMLTDFRTVIKDFIYYVCLLVTGEQQKLEGEAAYRLGLASDNAGNGDIALQVSTHTLSFLFNQSAELLKDRERLYLT